MALPPVDRLRRWCGQFYQRQVAVLWHKCHRLSQRVLQRPESLSPAVEPGLVPGSRLSILAGGRSLFRMPFAGQRLVWGVARRSMATVSSALNAVPVFIPTATAAADRSEAPPGKFQPQQQHVLIRLVTPTLQLTEDVRGSLETYRVAIERWASRTAALLAVLETLGFPLQRGDHGEICVGGGTAELAQILNRAKSNELSAIHVEASSSECGTAPYSTPSTSSLEDLSLIFPHLREAELEAFSDISSASLAPQGCYSN